MCISPQIHARDFFDVRDRACTDLFLAKMLEFRSTLHRYLFTFVAAYLPSDPKDPVARLNARFKAALGVSKLDRFGHSVGVCTVVHPMGMRGRGYPGESCMMCRYWVVRYDTQIFGGLYDTQAFSGWI